MLFAWSNKMADDKWLTKPVIRTVSRELYIHLEGLQSIIGWKSEAKHGRHGAFLDVCFRSLRGRFGCQLQSSTQHFIFLANEINFEHKTARKIEPFSGNALWKHSVSKRKRNMIFHPFEAYFRQFNVSVSSTRYLTPDKALILFRCDAMRCDAMRCDANTQIQIQPAPGIHLPFKI